MKISRKIEVKCNMEKENNYVDILAETAESSKDNTKYIDFSGLSREREINSDSKKYQEALAWLQYNYQRSITHNFFHRSLKSYQNDPNYTKDHNCYLFAQEYIQQTVLHERIGEVKKELDYKLLRTNPGSFYFERHYHCENSEKDLCKNIRELIIKDGFIPCSKQSEIPSGFKKIYCCIDENYEHYHFYSLYKKVGDTQQWVHKEGWNLEPKDAGTVHLSYWTDGSPLFVKHIDKDIEELGKLAGYPNSVGYFLLPDKLTRKQNIERQRGKENINPKDHIA